MHLCTQMHIGRPKRRTFRDPRSYTCAPRCTSGDPKVEHFVTPDHSFVHPAGAHLCTRRVLPACAFARTWVPPWRAACSWIVADAITENSTNVTENSTKVTENSTNVTGNSTKVAGTCHITAQQHNPPQTSGRGTRAWLHIQNNRDRAVCLVSSRRGLSGRCRMCNCVCIGPRVCGIEALGTGLGTGLVWARVSSV